jgi:hypothetical protein
MQRIGLRPALPMILEAYPHRQAEEIGEVLLEPLVASDFVGEGWITRPSRMHRNLSSRPAPLELMGMAYRPDHDGGSFSTCQ